MFRPPRGWSVRVRVLMSNLKSLFGRRTRRPAASRSNLLEQLEGRRLLSGGPVLTGVHLVGGVGAVTSVVLTFNESLDPVTAQDTHAYTFGKPILNSSESGPSLADFLPFLARPKVRAVKGGKIQFASATYDDATHSVTLAPYKPINARAFFRVLRVFGTGAHAIKDLAGNPLDGNSDGTGGDDAVVRWSMKQNKGLRYRDAGGDRVTLSLRGPGRLYVFKANTFFTGAWVFVDRPATRSILTGSVQLGANGDGKAIIPELEGTGGMQNGLLTNPQFTIQTTEG